MKLATREDISASIEAVFAQISDFDGFERAALRRGAEVTRLDDLAVPAPGMKWRTVFAYRGKERQAHVELRDYEVPERMRVETKVSGMELELAIDLLAMSKSRTRMNIGLEIKPRSIPAKLIVQSMKLRRQNVLKRFRKQVAEFAAGIENRAQAKG